MAHNNKRCDVEDCEGWVFENKRCKYHQVLQPGDVLRWPDWKHTGNLVFAERPKNDEELKNAKVIWNCCGVDKDEKKCPVGLHLSEKGAL